MNDQNLNQRIADAADTLQKIRAQVGRSVIGQQAVIDQVLIAFIAAGHVLIEGVPGLGKTLLARAMARTFDGKFARIQFTPDLMPNDITGHVMYEMKTEQFKIRRGPVFTHLLLADEINRAPAKTQSALLEVMQEQTVSIEGKPMSVPLPFMTLATQNPIEQEGTYPLPEAQLDRFLFKVLIAYPDEQEEQQMVKDVTENKIGDALDVSEVEQVVNPQDVIGLQKLAALVRVDHAVHEYAVRIARATRDWSGVRMGAGPRGGISMIRAARAIALINGRDFVTPDDIKHIALPVLRHRIILAPEMELEGVDTAQVLKALLARVEAPRT
ncbi:MAG: MoxR family ATPase [Gammaproteobacteria bacterium]|nr:MAG: MoxR family ATPase [Gammaproteobacteria bacterium]